MKINYEAIANSTANALQYISYYHTEDFLRALNISYKKEKSEQAKNAIGQILKNSKLCAMGKRPICQDTGIVTAFVEIGVEANLQFGCNVEQAINEGVRRAYLLADNPLRCSVVSDPIDKRLNTKDNTPAIVHISMVAGNEIKISLTAKGGGSENKSRSLMLNPSDNIADRIIEEVENMGAGWCPPGVLGVGIGGTIDKAAMLAKKSLFSSINIADLLERGANNALEELRIELYNKINNLGIGSQGLGGLTTVLDVKILDFPTHAASLPVVIIPNCAANRHIEFILDSADEAIFTAPNLNIYDDLPTNDLIESKNIDLDNLVQADIETWKSGDNLLFTGTIFTARDAAHARLEKLFKQGKKPPVNLDNKFIYYVGPVEAINGEAIGPAGPTTATRMDKYTEIILKNTGIFGMIGKAERGDETIKLLKNNKKVYLIAVGGAAYVISQSIKAAKVVAFDDLAMEAIYEMQVKNMPLQVAVDTKGNSIHKTGPAKWKSIIAKSK